MAKDTNKIALLLLLTLFLVGCGGKDTPGDNDKGKGEIVRLHTVMEMNKGEAVLNSHVGDELSSVLQPMWGWFKTIPHPYLTVGVSDNGSDNQKQAIYPRIKKMANGKYIMFYHSGQYGSRIWYTTSSDFRTWADPVLLYEPYTVDITNSAGKKVHDIRRFVNPDAAVLPNGDILMVCSYRATSNYKDGIDCGLSFRRSTDNGRSWSPAKDIAVGANWEPYLLVLPDGMLHCYYTDAIPQTRNSGTSVIVSEDNGATWSAKKRVSRQYKYDYHTSDPAKTIYNGQKIYTDQMPCFRVLNDGKTLVGWLEARIENPVPTDCSTDDYNSHCEMSLVWHDGFEWEDLGEESAGPERRLTNVMSLGSAGYISTFPSGEVVLSCNNSSLFRMRLCDATVTKFQGNSSWTDTSNWLLPFSGKGYWGCTEVIGSNLLVAAMHSAADGMQIGLFYLNQRLDAAHQTIVPDGDASEWTSDKAFYIGSKEGEELLVRVAGDKENLYFALDRNDGDLTTGSTVSLVLGKDGSNSFLNIKVGPSGLVSASGEGVSASTRKAKAEDGAEGYVAEVAVPLSLLGVSEGDRIRLYAILEEGNVRTPFLFADGSKPSTWQIIRL